MRLISILAILFALVLTPLLAEKDKTPVSDDVIVDQVRVRIADDSEVGGQADPGGRPQRRGGAHRQGHQRQAQSRRLEKLAKKVKGVTGVDNKLVVSPTNSLRSSRRSAKVLEQRALLRFLTLCW